jgi:hypothetical protein
MGYAHANGPGPPVVGSLVSERGFVARHRHHAAVSRIRAQARLRSDPMTATPRGRCGCAAAGGPAPRRSTTWRRAGANRHARSRPAPPPGSPRAHVPERETDDPPCPQPAWPQTVLGCTNDLGQVLLISRGWVRARTSPVQPENELLKEAAAFFARTGTWPARRRRPTCSSRKASTTSSSAGMVSAWSGTSDRSTGRVLDRRRP